MLNYTQQDGMDYDPPPPQANRKAGKKPLMLKMFAQLTNLLSQLFYLPNVTYPFHLLTFLNFISEIQPNSPQN